LWYIPSEETARGGGEIKFGATDGGDKTGRNRARGGTGKVRRRIEFIWSRE